MSGFLNRLSDSIREKRDRYQNRDFLEAAMAACALVAMADRVVTFSERSRMDRILETAAKLKIYDPHEAVDLFNTFADALAEDPDAGRRAALEAIEKEADDPADAHVLARICAAISLADGSVPREERHEIEEICRLLKVAPPDLEP